MALIPVKPTTPETDFSKFLTMVYGAPKVGKSTFCAGLDNPLFLDTENGLKSLTTYRVNIGSWEDFQAVCKELVEQRGKLPYKTLVIDTIDNLFGYCRDYVRKKLHIQHESDASYREAPASRLKALKLTSEEYDRFWRSAIRMMTEALAEEKVVPL